MGDRAEPVEGHALLTVAIYTAFPTAKFLDTNLGSGASAVAMTRIQSQGYELHTLYTLPLRLYSCLTWFISPKGIRELARYQTVNKVNHSEWLRLPRKLKLSRIGV